MNRALGTNVPGGANEGYRPPTTLAGRIRERLWMNRVERLFVTLFVNLVKAFMDVSAQKYLVKKYSPTNAIYLEGIIYTTYYYLITFDKVGAVTLLFLQVVTTFMIYEVQYMLGTVILMGLLMTWYPGFSDYCHNQYVKICAMMLVKWVVEVNPPSFFFIDFFLLAIAFNYILYGESRGLEDFPLAGMFIGCLWCMHDKYHIDDVCGVGLLLIVWMYLKTGRVTMRVTRMIPDLFHAYMVRQD